MNSRVKLERRRFLKAVGATALTYPFLRGLPSYAAASGSAPTYMVLLFTPCGTVRPFWGATDANKQDVLFPAAGSAPTITNNFVFRDTLAPLAPVQNSVIVLDGLANKAAQGSHEAGMASLWTGITSTGGAGDRAQRRPGDRVHAQRGDAVPVDRAHGAQLRRLHRSRGEDAHDLQRRGRVRGSARRSRRGAQYVLPAGEVGQSGPDKKTFIRQKLFPLLNGELTAMQPRLCTE